MESKFKREKLFYSIAEVAEKFNVNQSKLRYLEKEFASLKPIKTSGNTRQYRKEDIEEIGRILQLKEQGFNSKGIKGKLKDSRSSVERLSEAKNCLQNVRLELLKLQTEFDEMDQEYFGAK
ncbi:transcriptional regulator [Bacteroidia bacterium]|nr:transcriptional regulator [Bacteroidia bacterium]